MTGALEKQAYLDLIVKAGFINIQIQKERKIEIPEEIIDKYLTPDKKQLWLDSNVGIFSMTYYAEKPAKDDCCAPTCCS